MTVATAVRNAHVDQRADGSYVITTYSRTTSGFWISDTDPILLPAGSISGEVGVAARDALDASLDQIETPPAEADLTGPLLRATASSSYTDYMRGTKAVVIRTSETGGSETVKVTPQQNSRGSGFKPIRDAVVQFAYDSPGQLGEAVMAALQLSTC